MVASGPRTFDPVRVGNLETDAWAAYYRHEWRRFLVAAVGMVAAGFGMGRIDTLQGAWLVLRANQAWAQYPDNDPAAARERMRRFYALVARRSDLDLDPGRAARLEVEWWRLHREHQHPERRVDAMGFSDRWVASGRDLDDPLLAQERALLVASYTALRRAVA